MHHLTRIGYTQRRKHTFRWEKELVFRFLVQYVSRSTYSLNEQVMDLMQSCIG